MSCVLIPEAAAGFGATYETASNDMREDYNRPYLNMEGGWHQAAENKIKGDGIADDTQRRGLK